MKKYLLPQEGQFYKANLHCHSIISDGLLTPKEIKDVYKKMGYSIVAFTDHDVMIPHTDLNDDEFLTLNGYEIEVNEEGEPTNIKCFHACLIALKPDNLKQVCWHREKYMIGNAINYRDQVQFDVNEPDYERYYTVECINDIIRRARENGFFVTYNHPTWSMEKYEQYIQYENLNAMEIANTICELDGYEGYSGSTYDDMLRSGKRMYCLATDDNHNKVGSENRHSRRWDSGGNWVMIKADKLEYRTITKAMEEGNFYSSCGPEIHELWIDDGRVHIKTSAVERIILITGNRSALLKIAEDDHGICEAAFDLHPDCKYFRLKVTDYRGKFANTNAYFLDKIF